MKNNFQEMVIQSAIAVCENAAYLPDGNVQVPTVVAEKLGEALTALAEYEEVEYAPYLKEGQTGLNSAQVALQRLDMDNQQLKVERLIDLADQMYLAFFDEVIIPGARYLILSKDETKETRFLPKEVIEAWEDYLK